MVFPGARRHLTGLADSRLQSGERILIPIYLWAVAIEPIEAYDAKVPCSAQRAGQLTATTTALSSTSAWPGDTARHGNSSSLALLDRGGPARNTVLFFVFSPVVRVPVPE
jgi:hypothetical protein